MSSEAHKIASKLREMNENTVTRTIIIPLMRCLGYTKVEFYGGTNEEGKDIVCWEEDKFGDIKLTVAQVKHFKFTNTASDSNSLQTVYNQLTACFAKKLPYSDKNEYSPSEALLITTHEVDTKTLLTRFSENALLRDMPIKIIDGIKLSKLLMHHNPNLVKQIAGIEVEITSRLTPTLNNEILLKALGFNEKVDLYNIYIDIDFSIGKRSTEIFFNASFNPIKKSCILGKIEWDIFKKIYLNLVEEFSISFLSASIEEIESNYNNLINAHIIWEENKLQLQNKHVVIAKELADVTLIVKKLRVAELQKEQEHQQKLHDKHPTPYEANNKRKSKKKLKKFESLEFKNAKKQLEKIELIEGQLRNELRILEDIKPMPSFSFVIDGNILANIITDKKTWIERQVRDFNSKKPDSDEVKKFISKCKNIIHSASNIFSNEYLFQSIVNPKELSSNRIDFESTRLKLPIEKVFESDTNIILLGEAGAGKTTSLQMYALKEQHNKDKFIIWAPLARMIQLWPDHIDEKYKVNNLEDAITRYLRERGVEINLVEFIEILKTRKVVLLLDGIDESIRGNPWMPKGIKNLSDKYSPKTQIIVTSRMSGAYLNEIPFFGVTLLPFTTQQRNEFIEKWFKNGDKATVKKIKNHLKENSAIGDIVKTPLLTTTLCVIAKHNIPLPNTEVKLYDDRLKLLTGYYDNVKGIKSRTSSTPQILETVALKAAYLLHAQGIRELTIPQIINAVNNTLKNNLTENQIINAVNELIDPCNILVPMTTDGKYGFGHLRFQEHLAANEIKLNRGIDILLLIEQPWWRDALILFSQMPSDLRWILTPETLHIISLNKIARDTCNKMFEGRPSIEQKAYNLSLAEHISSEEIIYENEDYSEIDDIELDEL